MQKYYIHINYTKLTENYTEARACESIFIIIIQEFILKMYLKDVSGKESVRQ